MKIYHTSLNKGQDVIVQKDSLENIGGVLQNFKKGDILTFEDGVYKHKTGYPVSKKFIENRPEIFKSL
jgi:hypothetical protein